MHYPNLFCIGFHKTGTSSLAKALYTLGYKVTGYFGTNESDITEEELLRIMLERIEIYNAVQDTPWYIYYKRLDQHLPGGKFILTERPAEKWIASVVKHFGTHRIKAHELIYGVPCAEGYEDVYIERYRQHGREVREYFIDRPDDLLIIDITQGDGWEKICPFLDLPIPPIPFPVVNQGTVWRSQLIPRIRQQMYWRIPGFEKWFKGDGIDIHFWTMQDEVYDFFAQIEEEWPTAEKIGQMTAEEKHSLGREMVQLARRQRQFTQTMAERLPIDFSPHPIVFEESRDPMMADLTTVKRYWDECKRELRNFIGSLSDDDLFVRHPSYKLRTYEAIRELISTRPTAITN